MPPLLLQLVKCLVPPSVYGRQFFETPEQGISGNGKYHYEPLIKLQTASRYDRQINWISFPNANFYNDLESVNGKMNNIVFLA